MSTFSTTGTEWVDTSLGEIAIWQSGGTPQSTKNEYYNGSIPWLIISDLNDSIIVSSKNTISQLGMANSSTKWIEKNAVLIAMYGSIGKLGIAGIRCTSNQAIASTRKILGGISYRFLFYLLMSIKAELVEKGKGGAQSNISLTVINSFPILLPPLAEQRRIVAKLDELLPRIKAARSRLEGMPGILAEFRKAVLAAACDGRLTEEWREKESFSPIDIDGIHADGKIRRGVPETETPNDAINAWELPTTWIAKSVGMLLRHGALIDVKDGNHGTNHPKVAEFTTSGLPFITAAQVNSFTINYDSAYKLQGKALEKIQVGFAKQADVIYTHKGSVGRVAIADRNCILTPQTTYYRCNPGYLDNRYLMYYLASSSLSEQVDLIKSQTTRDFVPISAQYLLYIKLPPLPEQREIVRRVDELFALADRAEASYQAAMERVDSIEQAILAKAFRGELVPQDPNDEPAEELLKRILAEKARLEAERPRRSRGRPAKAGEVKGAARSSPRAADGAPPKKRGRPRKNPA